MSGVLALVLAAFVFERMVSETVTKAPPIARKVASGDSTTAGRFQTFLQVASEGEVTAARVDGCPDAGGDPRGQPEKRLE